VQTYRLYFRVFDGHMVESEPFEAWDDDDAMKAGREKADGATHARSLTLTA
jgi:hypothetical protein